jgi:hypothetical protein
VHGSANGPSIPTTIGADGGEEAREETGFEVVPVGIARKCLNNKSIMIKILTLFVIAIWIFIKS